MRRRKMELGLVVATVALVCMLLKETPKPVEVPEPVPPTRTQASFSPPQVDLNLSEEARWLVTTTTDSYTPKVPMENLWSEAVTDKVVPPR